MEIEGKYSKSSFNLQVCNQICLYNLNEKYKYTNKFTFNINSHPNNKLISLQSIKNIFWFTLSYPWCIFKSAPYMIEYIDTLENLKDKSDYDKRFLDNCIKYGILDNELNNVVN